MLLGLEHFGGHGAPQTHSNAPQAGTAPLPGPRRVLGSAQVLAETRAFRRHSLMQNHDQIVPLGYQALILLVGTCPTPCWRLLSAGLQAVKSVGPALNLRHGFQRKPSSSGWRPTATGADEDRKVKQQHLTLESGARAPAFTVTASFGQPASSCVPHAGRPFPLTREASPPTMAQSGEKHPRSRRWILDYSTSKP